MSGVEWPALSRVEGGPWVALVLGLAVGSFLNVCIYRLPRGESLAWPGSRCPSCGHALRWYENIPVLSYLALRGRCAHCKAPISIRYPVVEAVTGVFFLAAAYSFEPGWLLVSRLVFGSALIALFAIDLEHHLLPNAITLPGIVVGMAFSFLAEPGWQSSLIGALAGGGALYAMGEAYYRLRGEEGLGMGDVKMLAMIGAFLGWKLMLLTLVLSSLTGSVIGVGVLATGRGDLKYALPFGTFLSLGAITAAFVGQHILDWYLGFY